MATDNFDAVVMSADACRRELGERVREALDRLGWQQVDLARAASLEKGTTSRIVTGRRIPAAGTLRTIADALGVHEEELLPGITDRCEGSPKEPKDFVRTTSTRRGRVLVEVRSEVDAKTAMEIERLAREGATR